MKDGNSKLKQRKTHRKWSFYLPQGTREYEMLKENKQKQKQTMKIQINVSRLKTKLKIKLENEKVVGKTQD